MRAFNVKQRLLMVALLPAALLAIALGIYFTWAGVRSLDQELRQRGLAMVRYLAPVCEYGVLSGQITALQGYTQAAARQPAVKAVLVVGSGGRILATSGHVSLGADEMRRALPQPVMLVQTASTLAFGAPIVRSVADVDDLFNEESARKPEGAGEEIGRVFVELDPDEVYDRQRNLLMRSFLLVLVGLGMTAGFALFAANRAAQPLNRLVAAVRAMSGGQYQTRVDTGTPGEIGVLEQGFNEMAQRVEEVHRDLHWRIEEATAHLAFQARHDSLTNLINRREFESRLEEAIETVQKGGVEICILFMDLDRFKQVNDTSGHLAGDELLRQLARLLQGRLREKDTVARLGGDEFGVILPDCPQENALQVAEDICRLVSNFRFVWQNQMFGIGISVGLVRIGNDMKTVASVLSAGDAACYVAKDEGGNHVHVHSGDGLPEQVPTRERWRDRIEQALHERRLRCDATPIRSLVASDDSPWQLAELGLSLNEARGTEITAAVFGTIAERAGLATLVDLRATEVALDMLAAARSHDAFPSLLLLVPLSAASIKSAGNTDRLLDLIRAHSCRAGLCLALPEEAVVRNIGEAGLLCAALHDAGCKVALTDFGGWLASFNHLDVVRPELIRLNRSLTDDLRRHRSAYALLRAIQEISVDRGIRTIADAVDDTVAVTALRELGIHYAQGRAIAPVEPVAAWLEGEVLRAG